MAKQRRKLEKKTDYKSRLRILVSGKTRLVARISLKNVLLQLVKYETAGDKILASAHSRELKKYGWEYNGANMSSAYLVGLLIAVKAKKNGIKEAVFDCGLRKVSSGGVLSATLKGAVDGGLKIPHNKEIFPDESRISGEHIAKYSKSLNQEDYKKIFSNYIKSGMKPEEIQKKFTEAKEKIFGS